MRVSKGLTTRTYQVPWRPPGGGLYVLCLLYQIWAKGARRGFAPYTSLPLQWSMMCWMTWASQPVRLALRGTSCPSTSSS